MYCLSLLSILFHFLLSYHVHVLSLHNPFDPESSIRMVMVDCGPNLGIFSSISVFRYTEEGSVPCSLCFLISRATRGGPVFCNYVGGEVSSSLCCHHIRETRFCFQKTTIEYSVFCSNSAAPPQLWAMGTGRGGFHLPCLLLFLFFR